MDLADRAESLEGSVRQLVEVVEANTRATRWNRRAIWVALVGLVVGVSGAGFGFWVDHQQDLDRCSARNEAMAEAAPISGEALIEEFGAEADPERVDRYRRNIAKRVEGVLIDC